MKSPISRVIVVSPSASVRIGRAASFLAARPSGSEVLLVGANMDATAGLARPIALAAGATFGWHRVGMGRLAATLAAPLLAELGLVPVGVLSLEALCARVVHRMGEQGTLGRFASVADKPGLPRALARTVRELRLSGVEPGTDLGDADLGRVYTAFAAELHDAKLADRADVLRLAIKTATSGAHLLLGHPMLLLDLAIDSVMDRDLVAALAARAPEVLATVAEGDERSLSHLRDALGVEAERIAPPGTGALARLQAELFSESRTARESQPDAMQEVAILSAPGESRECIEIARRIQREAAAGVPFDRIAILLRSTLQYRAHIEEALRRAGIPVFFAQGTVEPDPTGRAFLALLACAAEGLSARRFAEYLSLGEVPDAGPSGAPPPASPPGDLWVSPDEDSLPETIARAAEEEDLARTSAASVEEEVSDQTPVAGGTLRAPRRWERLLVEAAVIGGRPRWEKRIDGLRAERLLDLDALEDPDDPMADRMRREIADLESLRLYALPLLDELANLPREATWREWLDALKGLASRALRRPERVLAVLGELAPMAPASGVTLREVRLALGPRLTEMVVAAASRRYGRVYVGPAEAARGLAFDVVFVPGLAEKLFPQKVSQDPILRDQERERLACGLTTDKDRVASERLALRLAVGAAKSRVVLSYPRLDAEQSRPRTPSFYGLEVLRAAEGVLPGFDELALRADQASGARLGWPAPENQDDAIDEAEFDLALLARIFHDGATRGKTPEETKGMARYLLSVNGHLARALRSRAARWNLKGWTANDGLVSPGQEAKVALAKHAFAARSYSPTALQNFAACPYKFVLYAIHKLSPREEPEAIEELDPLQRGSLIHEVMFDLHVQLRDAGLLPVVAFNLEAARTLLDSVLDTVAAKYKDNLAPAIDRVWDDSVASIRADMREWLRRSSEEVEWTPAHFELSFGLKERRDRDAASVDDSVKLASGIQLRGSIDLVEKSRLTGAYRASDYKTGKARAPKDTIIGGGEILQPVFYALVLEKVLARAKVPRSADPQGGVEAGRLYYCTSSGDFEERTIALDAEARAGAQAVADTIGQAMTDGFFPAAPAKGGCEWCDYRVVCGPHEEQRTAKKRQDKLVQLNKLRDLK